MTDIIFGDGITFERPHANAPEWVKGKLHLKVDKLIPFVETHKNERGYVTLDLRQGKSGALYFALNTWKPEKFEKNVDVSDNDGTTSDGQKVPDFSEVDDPFAGMDIK